MGLTMSGRASLLLVAACGSRTALDALPKADASATPDAAIANGPCDRDAPFGAVIPVPGINTPFDDNCARLSQDELTIFFCSDRDHPGRGIGLDIYVATRARITEAFSNVQRVSSLSSAVEDSCTSFTADMLTTYFQRGSSRLAIFMARRPSLNADFTSPVQISVLSPPGWSAWNPYVLPDSSALYLVAAEPGQSAHIYRSVLDANGPRPPTRLDALARSEEGLPVATADDRVLYFGRSTNGWDPYVAKRQKASDPYVSDSRIEELSTPAFEVPTWVSADDCRLYLITDRPGGMGGYDIGVASRTR